MVRTNTLKLSREGLTVNAEVRAEKLTSENVEPGPEVVVRDERNGQRVEREQYDKATGATLPEGHGYRWVNEDGEEVPDEARQYYEVVDGSEHPISLFKPTLGRGRTLTAERWIPVSRLGEFLITRTYEMWGADESDEEQLFELAQYVQSYREAPVVPVVLQETLRKDWGILTPQFYGDDTFSIIVRVTRARVKPTHRMQVPAEPDEEESRFPTPEQEFPFE